MNNLDQTDDVRVAYWLYDLETCDEVRQSVYRLDPPLGTADGFVFHVVSSTTRIPCRFGYPVETLVFRSDAEGNITKWTEIGGGRTLTSPAAGIRAIGYFHSK